MQEDKLKGAALMVVANKQDVVNSMGADEIADVELLSLPWPFETHPFFPSFLFPLSSSLPLCLLQPQPKRCPGSNIFSPRFPTSLCPESKITQT